VSRVKELIDFIDSELEFDNTGHGISHSKRVLRNALDIAKNLEVDIDIITVASIVHDYIDHKLFKDQQNQIEKLKKKLRQFRYDDVFIEQVIDIITNISFSKGRIPPSLEGKIVQDADRLDSLGAIGIARTFQYGAVNKRKMFDETSQCTIAHFYDKLFKLEKLMNTKNAKKIAKEKTEFMRKFVEEFMDEWV